MNFTVARTYKMGLTTKSIEAAALHVPSSHKFESVSILSEGS